MTAAAAVLALRAAWSRSSYNGVCFGVQVANPSRRLTLFRWADYESKENGALGRAFGDEAAVAMAAALLEELKELRKNAEDRIRKRPSVFGIQSSRRSA